MKKTTVLVAFAMAFLSILSCENKDKKETLTEQEVTSDVNSTKESAYICPMDCEKGKTYPEPGKCSVCKMDLIAQESTTDHSGHNHTEKGDDHSEEGHDHSQDGHDHK